MKKHDISKLNLELHIYQLIMQASHAFKPGKLYSFPALAELIGATKLGVRIRALTDGWPFVEPSTFQGNQRKQRFVDGAYLLAIQKQGGKA